MTYAVYGAKSLALGMYKAIEYLYPDEECIGFVVNSRIGNPEILAKLPVVEMEELKAKYVEDDRPNLHILVCTPEDLHKEISEYLDANGFDNYTCMNSVKESALMEKYFTAIGEFESIHSFKSKTSESDLSEGKSNIQIYQAKFFKDRPLKNFFKQPEWVIPIQVGAELTDVRVADCLDNIGENISSKNVNYCELTALYWMWKNKLINDELDKDSYYGLYHYRRVLDIGKEDIERMAENNIDAVVAYPTLHEPDVFEHHARYIKESDWEAMLQALKELQPQYWNAHKEIFSGEYMYNYNMIVAKKDILADYCNWLFPILERTEELSEPKGWERKDRYIGYMGENLMTLYFFYNKDKITMKHAGRIMLI